jgi:GNAT superfamily N-acetyltransferase
VTDRVSVSRLGADDVAAVQLALYLALSWNDPPGFPDKATVMANPEVRTYYEGWGRPGDIGVEAVLDGQLIGAAFARLFTEDNHGHGYVDDQTPEVGIGIVAAYRGMGIGRRLMDGLAAVASQEGITRLSLSVNNPNPARRLYESLGYVLIGDDGDSSVMVLDL